MGRGKKTPSDLRRMEMSKDILFTDGSVDPKSRTGFGAYFQVSSDILSVPLDSLREEDLLPAIKLRRSQH